MASEFTDWVDFSKAQEETLVTRVDNMTLVQDANRQEVGGGGNVQEVPLPTEESTDEGEDDVSPGELSLLRKVLRKGLVASTSADLEVKQRDHTSPLYSVRTFEALNLRPELYNGVIGMGFNKPSRIQETALPILLNEPPKNLIAQSQSGTGKTAAFVLAMLSRVDPTLDYPHVLCLSPTYELAIQTGEVIRQMGQYCNDVSVIYAVRGTDSIPYNTKVKQHIIIGTPGKITDWAFRSKYFDLTKIRVFVLDEADVMIATQGYQDASIRIHRKLPSDCQQMLFSATYSHDVMEFAGQLIPDAVIVRLRREEESLDNIQQYWIQCASQDDKYRAIANIYGGITIGQAMIFCKTRKTAAWLAGKLTNDGHAVALLSGELQVEQRLSVLTRFREGVERILITTNVMARGIDVEQVTLVVNYDLPVDVHNQPDCETYLHRIGRTGRFGKTGIAINLIDGSRSMDIMRRIESHFGKAIVKLDSDDVAEIEKLDS